ncbi:hypothetical protein SAMN05720766_101222 [Fibrobacter sp. UWH9]|uniref:hypothetical protein n=1 Tax=Fibrobacter sp. UWH9 TaxID=1896213 RepID=UPI00092130FE|nr:hypothetical protein [Fibrobacter sp. UWH9]SHG33391.1 hypothetical protein SAMN05720766_101222 [Fibrobacter sp. UWH9]
MFVSKSSPTYVKLQDAYVAEKGIRIGNWKEIGYLMKNSSNFYYCDQAAGTACTASNNGDGHGTTGTFNEYDFTVTWTATNVATLNDCPAGKNWSLTTSGNSSAGGLVTYTATVDGASTAGGDCEVLTPNFLRLHTAASSN